MPHVIILAGSAKEANAYRRDHALPKGRAIHASSAIQIEGVVPSEVHTLPGFAKRRDVHAIAAALKRASRRYQDIKWVTYDDRGFLTDRALEVAYRYNALRGEVPQVANIAPETFSGETDEERKERQYQALAEMSSLGSDDPDHEAPVRIPRRSRCKDCGALHFKSEPCQQVDPSFFEV